MTYKERSRLRIFCFILYLNMQATHKTITYEKYMDLNQCFECFDKKNPQQPRLNEKVTSQAKKTDTITGKGIKPVNHIKYFLFQKLSINNLHLIS